MEIINLISDEYANIIITTQSNKYNVMRKLNMQAEFMNVQIMTENEFNEIMFGSYEKEAINEIIVFFQSERQIKLNIKVAQKYLKTMVNLSDEMVNETELIDDLIKIKQRLIKSGLINLNLHRKLLFRNKNIILDDILVTKKLLNALNKLGVHQIKKYQTKSIYQQSVNEFSGIYEEVEFVCLEMAKLVNSGVSINKIKVHTPSSEYYPVLNQYLSLYNLPSNLNEKRKLITFDYIKKLIEMLKINDDLMWLEEFEVPAENQELFNQFISVLNFYPTVHHNLEMLRELVINELETTNIAALKVIDVIEFINLEEYVANDDEYIFCLNFAEQKMPKVKKDVQIVSDKIAKKYGLTTSEEYNRLIKQKMISKLSRIKHLCLTFARQTISGEEQLASIKEALNLDVVQPKVSTKRFSQASDRLNYAKALELKNKYATKSFNYYYFNKYDGFKFYDNQINNLLYRDETNQLDISATSIQKFFECEYKFYLDKVLAIRTKIKDMSAINLGNLYHFVLENAQKNQVDTVEGINALIKSYLKEHDSEFNSNSQKYYLDKYAVYLHEIISVIYEFHESSDFKLDHAVFEQEFGYMLDEVTKVKLIGKVDKFVELDLGNKFYIVIIDYKTKKTPKIDHKLFEFGLDLQNFIYLNLIKADREDDAHEFELIGTYQQRIKPIHLHGHGSFSDDFKLFGYTTSDENKMRMFEPNYQDKELSQLANMSTTKSGAFSRHAKVYDEESLSQIEAMIKEHLKTVVNKVGQSDYQINPKLYKKNNVSCKYCEYQAICYRKKQNLVELKEQDDKS